MKTVALISFGRWDFQGSNPYAAHQLLTYVRRRMAHGSLRSHGLRPFEQLETLPVVASPAPRSQFSRLSLRSSLAMRRPGLEPRFYEQIGLLMG
jgi:hypothetical protein